MAMGLSEAWELHESGLLVWRWWPWGSLPTASVHFIWSHQARWAGLGRTDSGCH